MDNRFVGMRIKAEREAKGLTLQDIADEIGVAKSTVQRYEAGNIESIKLPVLAAIANALRVNPDYLIGKSDNKDTVFQYDNVFPIEKKKVRLIGDIACGDPIYANEDFDSYVECGANVPGDFCVRAIGDSMINARINDGDIVFIREQPTVDNGEIAAVVIGDSVTLKRVYKKPGSLILMPENPAYEPQVYAEFELDQIRILGKAIAFQSDIK